MEKQVKAQDDPGKPMSPWTFRSIAALSLAFLGATAVHAQAQTGNYAPTEAGVIHRAAPAEPATGSSYNIGGYPTFRASLAPGDGSREVNTYCSVCHTPRYITLQPVLPGSAWAVEVNKMIKTYGAIVPDEAAQKIITYLQSHYTSETRQH